MKLILGIALASAATRGALGSPGCDSFHQSTFYLHNDIIGPPVLEPFVGFSLEVPHAPLYLRTPAFIQLMRHLRDAGGLGKGPHVRVGGFTQDSTSYVGQFSSPRMADRVQSFSRIRGTFSDGDIADLAFAERFNGTLTVGLNFAMPDHHELAISHLQALRATLPAGLLTQIEIGNEPDRFASPRVRFRSGGYTYAGYKEEVQARLNALSEANPQGDPGIALSGPAFTQDNPPFLSHVGDFGRTFGSPPEGGGQGILGNLNVHYYPLLGCAGQRFRPRSLLRSGRPRFVGELVRAARAAGVRAIIGEGNSVTCGGREGLSDTFAAALWAVDTWLDLSRAGIARFNVHGGPAYPYTPIAMEAAGVVSASPAPRMPAAGRHHDDASDADHAEGTQSTGKHGGSRRRLWSEAVSQWGRRLWGDAGGLFALTTDTKGRKHKAPSPSQSPAPPLAPGAPIMRPRPLYYAALVVSTVQGGGAAPVSYARYCCGRGFTCTKQGYLKPFAYRAPNGDLRLLLVNTLLPDIDSGAGNPHKLQVAAPAEGLRRADGTFAPVASAKWYVLSAPNHTSVYDVTWAGMSFDGSVDGRPTSPLAPVVLQVSGDKFFPPDLPSGSVGMLVLSATA